MKRVEEWIDRIVEEHDIDERGLLHALICGLLRNHMLGAEAFPDFAAPEGTPGAIAEILGLQHWNSKPVWKYGQSMPPFESLFEAVWMSICHESIVNEDVAVDMDNHPDCTDEQSEQAHDLYYLAQHQEAVRCLLEELICEIADERLEAKMKRHVR